MSTFPELELHVGSPLRRGDCARLLEMLGLVPAGAKLTRRVP